MNFREAGTVINTVVMIATCVNADGRREMLGVQAGTSETATVWKMFFATWLPGV